MSKFNTYLEAATVRTRMVREDESFEAGDEIYYDGKKGKVVSDEGETLIVKIGGKEKSFWKIECEKELQR